MVEKKTGSRTGNIVIRGVQRLDGQEDINEVTTTATYYVKDGKRFLFYKEYMEDGGFQKVRLTIDQKEVILKKTGMGESTLHFEKGKLMACHYQSVVGPMELISKTRKIRIKEGEHSLLLKMDYSLYMYDQLMSDYELEIRWQEN